MITRQIVQLAAIISLLLSCGAGETPAPALPRTLPVCLGAATWNVEEFCLEP